MGLGPMELAIILVIALVIFGPSRLPGLGKAMGDAIRGFKKGVEGADEKEAQREQLSPSETARTTADRQKDKSED